MKLGVACNYVWFGPPITELAGAIERLGFESMWMGEHPIIPIAAADVDRHGVPLPENYKHMPDLFVSLAAAAAVTERIKLGTNICIVPQHNPIMLAKQAATLDRISNGRLIMGCGTGWIAEEADVFGYPFDKRLGLTLDTIRAMKVLWKEYIASYSGEYVSFPPMYCNPKPLQQPHIPILVGAGNEKTDNTKVIRRVAKMGDGWLPMILSPAQMKEQLALLREFCDEEGRDYEALDISVIVPALRFGLGPLPSWGAEAYDHLRPQPAHELLAEYEEAGVGRILVGLPDLEDDSAYGLLEDVAAGLGLS